MPAIQTYLGLTIGPIYKTLEPLRRTRAIFAGSYLFSFIMRQILSKLTAGEFALKGTILIPFVPQNPKERAEYLQGGKGVGLFPDRLLIQAGEGDFDRLQNVCNAVLTQVKDMLEVEAPAITDEFIRQYFQFYALSVDMEPGENTILEISRLLDNLELQNLFITSTNPDALTNYLAKPKLKRTAGTLMYDAMGLNPAFPSLPRIALRGLRKLDRARHENALKSWMDGEKERLKEKKTNENDDGRLMGKMKENFPRDFRQYHKYIAIVQADGDRMGKQLEETKGDPAKLHPFSEKLYEFGRESLKIIRRHRGRAVYIGGDDILFFAPVAIPGDKPDSLTTIFDCIAKLDKAFHRFFPKGKDGPTMSYGISISYYKFPLNEARADAYDLLFHKAKGDKNRHPDKNAIEFKVIKHSGAFFEGGYNKNAAYYDLLPSLLSTGMADEKWLNSIIYFLQYFEPILPNLGLDELKNLFRNRLDEPVHKKNADFLYQQLPEFIYQVFNSLTTTPDGKKQATDYTEGNSPTLSIEKQRQAFQTIFATLRFIQFVRSSDKDN